MDRHLKGRNFNFLCLFIEVFLLQHKFFGKQDTYDLIRAKIAFAHFVLEGEGKKEANLSFDGIYSKSYGSCGPVVLVFVLFQRRLGVWRATMTHRPQRWVFSCSFALNLKA